MGNSADTSTPLEKRECTLGGIKANLLSIAVIIPPGAFLALLFWSVWEDKINAFTVFGPIHAHPYVTIGVLLAGMLVHELLHGVTFSLFTEDGLKSIKFGFQWKAFAPYCHCKVPLESRHYKTALVMPGLLLGLLPSIIGLGTGSIMTFAYGWIFTLAAGGDILMLLLLKDVSPHSLVQDHPEKIGCLIYERQLTTS